MEMTTQSGPLCCWRKVKVSEETLRLMDATAQLCSEYTERNFHSIKFPFNKRLVCQLSGLTFFHLSCGGKPPSLVTTAIEDVSSRLLLPSLRIDDFEYCCAVIGLDSDENRKRFRESLTRN